MEHVIKILTFTWYSNDMFHTMFKSEFVALVHNFKSPVGFPKERRAIFFPPLPPQKREGRFFSPSAYPPPTQRGRRFFPPRFMALGLRKPPAFSIFTTRKANLLWKALLLGCNFSLFSPLFPRSGYLTRAEVPEEILRYTLLHILVQCILKKNTFFVLLLYWQILFNVYKTTLIQCSRKQSYLYCTTFSFPLATFPTFFIPFFCFVKVLFFPA